MAEFSNKHGDRRGVTGHANLSAWRKKNKIEPGLRRGRLTVISRDGGTDRHPRYRVRCDCGVEYTISGGTLSVARGCKKCRPGGAKRKYGERLSNQTPIYLSWVGMRRRCKPGTTDPHNARWGSRGIRVCDEWSKSFEAFEKWSLANGYKPGLSLDRIDVDGNYEPANCQWVTRSVNSKRCRAQYTVVRVRPLFEDGHFPIEFLWGNA